MTVHVSVRSISALLLLCVGLLGLPADAPALNFATFSNEVFTVSERNGRLVLDIPSQLQSALHPPRADGRWSLMSTDQLAVSFDRDRAGRVVGLKLHEGGLEFEVPREGVDLPPDTFTLGPFAASSGGR